jgi:hypothetical protein
VADVLVHPLHTSHLGVILMDNIRLQDIHLLLLLPGVHRTGGDGSYPKDIADHGHWSIVIPSDDYLGLILQDNSLMVAPLLLLELLHNRQGRISL